MSENKKESRGECEGFDQLLQSSSQSVAQPLAAWWALVACAPIWEQAQRWLSLLVLALMPHAF